MTQETTQAALARINRSMLIVAIIDFPGTLLFGLGLYGIFAGFDQGFLPILSNTMIISIMLIVGGVVMAWGIFRMINLAREKQGVIQQCKN
jgi:hypothetical protein